VWIYHCRRLIELPITVITAADPTTPIPATAAAKPFRVASEHPEGCKDIKGPNLATCQEIRESSS
jgi:hypothetical protein